MKILKLKGYYSAGTLCSQEERFLRPRNSRLSGQRVTSDADHFRYGTKDSSRCGSIAHTVRESAERLGSPIKEVNVNKKCETMNVLLNWSPDYETG